MLSVDGTVGGMGADAPLRSGVPAAAPLEVAQLPQDLPPVSRRSGTGRAVSFSRVRRRRGLSALVRCEIYWGTGLQARQPYLEAVDLDRPNDEILRRVEESVRQHGRTGYIDPTIVRERRVLAHAKA